MPIYAVQYHYQPDRDADRDRHRDEHRGYLQSLTDSGTILLRGPYADANGGPGALLVLRAESPEQVTTALDPDPFNREGLIRERVVREWTLVGTHPFG